MALSPLAAYIQSLQRNGYGEQQIRSYLLSSHYQPQQIEVAYTELRSVSMIATPAQHPPWLWVAGAVLGLGIGGIIIALLVASPAAQLTLSASTPRIEVRAGDIINIDTLVGGDDSVTLTHQLINPTTKEPVGTPAAATTEGGAKKTTSLPVPAGTTPGRYLVSVSASTAEGASAQTSFSIRVLAGKVSCVDGTQNQDEEGIDCGGPCAACGATVEPPTGEPAIEQPAPVLPEELTLEPVACPGGCNDLDASTDDACVDNQCVHTPLEEQCGNTICNAGETSRSCAQDCGAGPSAPSAEQSIEEARSVAARDPERAAALCNALPRPGDRDRCYGIIALDAGQSTLCTVIVEDVPRDQCYLDFALNRNEFDVCEKIVNRYMRGSCNSLRNLRQLERERADALSLEEPAAQTPAGPVQCTSRPTECDDSTDVVCADNGRTFLSPCLACQDVTVTGYTPGAC